MAIFVGNVSKIGNLSLHYNFNQSFPMLYDMYLPVEDLVVLRVSISIIYSLVCALGLVGNLLVIFLMVKKRHWKKSAINTFVFALSITDLQFILTLPVWAVEVAMDFDWPFGSFLCKLVSCITIMDMYASVYFLTAICITRYCTIASGVKVSQQPRTRVAVVVSVIIWMVATAASAPHAIFSGTFTIISDEELHCLVRFPGTHEQAQFWLALYHLQKIILGFMLPLVVILTCYGLLLRYVRRHTINNISKNTQVKKTVTIIVSSFFCCWLPNQAITLWGVLVKMNHLPFSRAFYTAQYFMFPITICLTHINSCLNPIMYCLMRTEFRKNLKEIFWRTPPTITEYQVNPFIHELHMKKQNGGGLPTVIPMAKLDSDLFLHPSMAAQQLAGEDFIATIPRQENQLISHEEILI